MEFDREIVVCIQRFVRGFLARKRLLGENFKYFELVSNIVGRQFDPDLNLPDFFVIVEEFDMPLAFAGISSVIETFEKVIMKKPVCKISHIRRSVDTFSTFFKPTTGICEVFDKKIKNFQSKYSVSEVVCYDFSAIFKPIVRISEGCMLGDFRIFGKPLCDIAAAFTEKISEEELKPNKIMNEGNEFYEEDFEDINEVSSPSSASSTIVYNESPDYEFLIKREETAPQIAPIQNFALYKKQEKQYDEIVYNSPQTIFPMKNDYLAEALNSKPPISNKRVIQKCSSYKDYGFLCDHGKKKTLAPLKKVEKSRITKSMKSIAVDKKMISSKSPYDVAWIDRQLIDFFNLKMKKNKNSVKKFKLFKVKLEKISALYKK